MNERDELERYRELGYAIIQQAVEDYRDLLTLLLPENWYKYSIGRIRKAVFNYGKTRYLTKDAKKNLVRRKEIDNKRMLTRIRNLLTAYETHERIDEKVNELEEFFTSEWFEMLTPGIDGIRTMKGVKESLKYGKEKISD